MREKSIYYSGSSISLEVIGIITWLVFLIIKLTTNPSWLTWFWVWFPLWIPIAVGFAFLIIILILIVIFLGIVKLIDR